MVKLTAGKWYIINPDYSDPRSLGMYKYIRRVKTNIYYKYGFISEFFMGKKTDTSAITDSFSEKEIIRKVTTIEEIFYNLSSKEEHL